MILHTTLTRQPFALPATLTGATRKKYPTTFAPIQRLPAPLGSFSDKCVKLPLDEGFVQSATVNLLDLARQPGSAAFFLGVPRDPASLARSGHDGVLDAYASAAVTGDLFDSPPTAPSLDLPFYFHTRRWFGIHVTMRYYGYAYAIRRSTRICDAVFDHDQTFYDHAYYADNMRCGMRSDVLRSDVFTTFYGICEYTIGRLYADMRVCDQTLYADMRVYDQTFYANIRSDVCV